MDNLNINQKTLCWLNSVNGISRGKTASFLEYFGSFQELWDNFESEKFNLSFLNMENINSLSSKKN